VVIQVTSSNRELICKASDSIEIAKPTVLSSKKFIIADNATSLRINKL